MEDDTKQECIRCKKQKSKSEFYGKRNKNKILKRCSGCREKQAEYQRKKRKEQKDDKKDEKKENHKRCSNCKKWHLNDMFYGKIKDRVRNMQTQPSKRKL